MELLRAVSRHEVAIGGRGHEVAPPSVLQALTILTAADGAAKGDHDAMADLKAAVRAWLPLRLYWTLFPPRWMVWNRTSPALAVADVTAMLQLGVPEPKGDNRPDDCRRRRGEPEKPRLTPEEAMQRFLRTDWTLCVAEVAHAVSLSPNEVLALSWPLFLLLLARADAMRARWQLDYMAAKSLPYIESQGERTKAYDALQKRAGYVEEKTREEKLADQRALFEQLKKQINPGAGGVPNDRSAGGTA